MNFSKREMLEYMLQFAHLEKILAVLPVVNDDTCAAHFGIDVATYREINEQFVARSRGAAQEMLADPEFAYLVDRVPFGKGEKIIGFGSSSTDSSQSWFEILRHVFELRRPQGEIRFVNAGLSNDSTNHLIARFIDVVREQPDWIICQVSSNDARRHGPSPTKTLVSPEETEKNLRMLRHFAASQTSARWLWMTPTSIIEERIAANPLLVSSQATFLSEDVARITDAVLKQPDPVVNLWPLFGHPADHDLVLWDGIHPSLAGHMRTVQALISQLSQL